MLLTTHYPGWQVRVDGKAQPLRKVSGYLAVAALPGVHQYIFEYKPKLFFIGLWISLVCLAITGVLLFSDLQPELGAAWAGLKSIPGRLRGYGRRLGGKLRVERGTPAVYREGALIPAAPLGLEEGAAARITLEAPAGALAPGVSLRRWLWASYDLLPRPARLALVRDVPVHRRRGRVRHHAPGCPGELPDLFLRRRGGANALCPGPDPQRLP